MPWWMTAITPTASPIASAARSWAVLMLGASAADGPITAEAATDRVDVQAVIEHLKRSVGFDRYRSVLDVVPAAALGLDAVRGAKRAYIAALSDDRYNAPSPAITPLHRLVAMAIAEVLIERYRPEIDRKAEQWTERLDRYSIEASNLLTDMLASVHKGQGLVAALLNAPIRKSQEKFVIHQALWVLKRTADDAANAPNTIIFVSWSVADDDSPAAGLARKVEEIAATFGQCWVSSDTGSDERHSAQFKHLDQVQFAAFMDANTTDMSEWLSHLLKLGLPIGGWTRDQQVTLAALQFRVEKASDLVRVRSHFLGSEASGGRQQKSVVKKKFITALEEVPLFIRAQVVALLSVTLLRMIPPEMLEAD